MKFLFAYIRKVKLYFLLQMSRNIRSFSVRFRKHFSPRLF